MNRLKYKTCIAKLIMIMNCFEKYRNESETLFVRFELRQKCARASAIKK